MANKTNTGEREPDPIQILINKYEEQRRQFEKVEKECRDVHNHDCADFYQGKAKSARDFVKDLKNILGEP